MLYGVMVIYVASEHCMILCSSGDVVKLPGMVSQVVGEKAPATSG